jgi:agmatine deiminase
MITDDKTDTVYISKLLKTRHPQLHHSLGQILREERISLLELRNTMDIWCCDYMPIQVSDDGFVMFRYDPDYLYDEEFLLLKTNQEEVIAPFHFNITKSDLIVDGGNLVRHERKVILTDKIYTENPDRTHEEILQELRYFLEAEEIIIIPKVPYDYTGHADGMVRFVDANSVLLNDFSKLGSRYFEKLKKSLTSQGLNITLLPWDGWRQKKLSSDLGDYINFLHVGNLIIVPEFKEETDEEAKAIIRQCFPNANVKGLDCAELALGGGVLHCCTWNIKS